MFKTFSLHILLAILCLFVVAPVIGILLPGFLATLAAAGIFGVSSTAISASHSDRKALTR